MTSRDDGPQRMRVDRRTLTLVHTPFVHVLPPAHTFPQEPQLLLSVLVSTHWLLQAVSPAPQTSAHTPFVHAVPAPHTFPQEPQLLLSELVFTHELPHFVSPPAQKSVHTPFEQT
jgi:hypothetical protein